MSDETIRVGDVCVDLAQGRPVQVLAVPNMDAREWSERNDYELTENYANGRLGATDSGGVYECVYVSDIRSQPSKTYTFPEARLVRIEVEAASDTLGRVQDEWTEQLLVGLFAVAGREEDGIREGLDHLARASGIPEELVDRARELADVERRAAADGGESSWRA